MERKNTVYKLPSRSQKPIKIEFEGPVINRVDISFPEPVLVWHNTDANSERRFIWNKNAPN